MIYIVTGIPRSGTSMAMRAIIESHDGTLKPLWDPSVYFPAADPDYDPNPNGYYEASTHQFSDGGLTAPDNTLVKVRLRSVGQLWSKEYRVLWMRRDPTEVETSQRRAFGQYLADEAQAQPYIEILATRRNVELVSLDYGEVISEPEIQFGTLASAGWPIDPVKAAAAVDPALYRNRH